MTDQSGIIVAIAEFVRLDIAEVENDGLEIGKLVPAAPVAAVPQQRCCEVCFLAPIEGLDLVPCSHARFCENCARHAERSSTWGCTFSRKAFAD